MKRVAVIGAGASGLMAAYAAASGGAAVTVFEKNEKAGKKIYITGKGRCNVTNDCSPETFLENVVRGEKFLIGAAHAFPPAKTMRFLEENGLPLKVERGNRVFPLSEKASDVTKCLENCCRRAGVRFLFGTCVEEIEKSNGGWSLIANKKRYEADAVIVCTGGVSYPATGSTGDGYRFAKQLGLEVTPLRPSLCGIVCKADWLPQVQGLTLKNVELAAFAGPKKIVSFFGEMLFTHFGVSGPIVLSLSALLNRKELSDVSLSTKSLQFGTTYNERDLVINNIGNSPISWQITNITVDWLSVTPSVGSTSEGKSSTVKVMIDRSKITKDVNTSFNVEAAGGSQSVQVFVSYKNTSSGNEGDEPAEPGAAGGL